MTDKTTVARAIRQLSVSQLAVIRNLDERPSSLGCSEPIAHRLSKATSSRGPLTVSEGRGVDRTWSLTELGLSARNYLLAHTQ